MDCTPGRKGGLPTPAWWPAMRDRLRRYRSEFPPTIPLSFLGAWIEKESDGRHDLGSSLGEVGYFQLHPEEIADAFGTDKVAAIKREITSAPGPSIRWGAWLLRSYDRQLQSIGVPRGTDFYLGMLKAMHWSPWARIWAQHVRHGLGYWPDTYATFHAAVDALQRGLIAWDPNVKRPSRAPSCSPLQVLARAPMFPAPEDQPTAHRGGGVVLAAMPAPLTAPFRMRPSLAPIAPSPFNGSLGAYGFPALRFGRPADGNLVVTSVWGDGRSGNRPVGHEGIDIPLAIGTAIRAVADGVVFHSGRSSDPDAGVWVGIQHSNGWVSRYMHLADTVVSVGARVDRGDRVGTAGSSGIRYSAPHLHFSLLLDEALLGEYAAAFGMPSTGWGRHHGRGVAVPSEPLIPVDSYTTEAAKRMIARGVSAYVSPTFLTGPVFASLALIALGGLGGYIWWTRRKRRRRK